MVTAVPFLVRLPDPLRLVGVASLARFYLPHAAVPLSRVGELRATAAARPGVELVRGRLAEEVLKVGSGGGRGDVLNVLWGQGRGCATNQGSVDISAASNRPRLSKEQDWQLSTNLTAGKPSPTLPRRSSPAGVRGARPYTHRGADIALAADGRHRHCVVERRDKVLVGRARQELKPGRVAVEGVVEEAVVGIGGVAGGRHARACVSRSDGEGRVASESRQVGQSFRGQRGEAALAVPGCRV